MVKLTGPAMSEQAAGKLGDALTFANLFKTPYLKKQSTPRNPKTDPQKAVREMVRYVAQQWKHLTEPERQSWETVARLNTIPRYHAYIKYNCDRWTHFKAPTTSYPAAEATVPALYFTYARFARYKWVEHGTRVIPPDAPWGFWFHRSTTPGFTPSRENVIGFSPHTAAIWTFYKETPVESGTYYHRATEFYRDGVTGYTTIQYTLVMP